MRTLLLASALFAGLLGSPVPGPAPDLYHAFCKTMWLFATPCDVIASKLGQQIQASSPRYTLVIFTPGYIEANHTSPDGPEGENIEISLSSTALTHGCRATAMSTSLGFTSLVDGGLNYCNLFHLLSASHLVSSPGFVEMTNEWACLGYGLAACRA